MLYGDPAGAELWQELDSVLRQKVLHASGASLPIRAACIDSGGHFTAERLQLSCGTRATARSGRRKAQSQPACRLGHGADPCAGRTRATPLYLIGTEALKDALAARLRIEEAGPGYCHFPIGRGLDWYEGLTTERPIRRYHKGVAAREWVKTASARNEPLDCRCLAQAALEGLKASGMRLEIEAKRVREPSRGNPRSQYSGQNGCPAYSGVRASWI